MSVVEVRVPHLDSNACVSKLKKSIFNLKGVKDVEIDVEEQKVIVRGYLLEQKKVLRAIRRVGITAEAWKYHSGHPHFTQFSKYSALNTNNYYGTTNNTPSSHIRALPSNPSFDSRALVVASDGPILRIQPTNQCSIM